MIYWCILSRLHDDSTLLVNMGLDNIGLHAIWVSCIGLIVLNVSEFQADSNSQVVETTKTKESKGNRLQPNRSLLSF